MTSLSNSCSLRDIFLLKRRNKTQINKIYLSWFRLKANVLKTEEPTVRPVNLVFLKNLLDILGRDGESLYSSAWIFSDLPEHDRIFLYFKSKRSA